MNIIICLDDNNGMLFNNRRQSKDSEVTRKITEIVKDNRFFIHTFSTSLFNNNYLLNDNMLDTAGENDFCFVENLPLLPHISRIRSIYVFRWNRIYPYDMATDIDFNKLTLIRTEEFKGNSHDKITLEVYTV